MNKTSALGQRIITALVLIPLVIWTVFAIETGWFALATGVVIVLGASEWARLSGFTGGVSRGVYVLFVALLLAVCFVFLPAEGARFPMLLAAAAGWFFATLLVIGVQKQWFDPGPSRAVDALVGLFVLVPAWLGLVLLHGQGGAGRRLIMLLFVMIWAADIAAYFAGRRFGKSALAARISPKKTIEGALAGIVASLFAAAGFAWRVDMQHNDIIIFLAIALVTVMISIVGDLFESLMKRRAQLKDSGSLLPGHGGVLDRIDSLTAAAPVFVAGLHLAGLFP